jgi:sulfide:quinone oxidoreductase
MLVLFINRVSIGKVSKTDMIEFSKYYNEFPKPILMICRSGTPRSSLLFDEAKKLGLLNE